MTLNRNAGFWMLGIGLIIMGIVGLVDAKLPSILIYIWMIITGILIILGR